ncbi:MAG: hypothetical protein [Caudoviricetes sp.]|nr:MAG: hypothetical protein [Caudoviricetes sp.]
MIKLDKNQITLINDQYESLINLHSSNPVSPVLLQLYYDVVSEVNKTLYVNELLNGPQSMILSTSGVEKLYRANKMLQSLKIEL